MKVRTRQGHTARLAQVGVAAGTILALAACTPVAGDPTADPAGVQAHAAAVESSRAAVAAEAGRTACTSWTAASTRRTTATRAMNTATRAPGATWDSIASRLEANLNAIESEARSLDSTIPGAEPNANIHTLLLDYRAKLVSYGQAIRDDRQARGEGEGTWPKTNPAGSALDRAATALRDACRS